MPRTQKKSSINTIIAIVTCSGTNVIVEILGTTEGRAGAEGADGGGFGDIYETWKYYYLN